MDASAAKELGITVTNTPGTLSQSVAELTVGLLLDASRKLTVNIERYSAGEEGLISREMSSMRVGIVGLGSIGSSIAKLLKAYGCEVAYTSPSRKPKLESELAIGYKELADLASWAEAVVVIPIANDSTRGLINQSIVDQLHPDTILVNTSKPFVVDSGALLSGLKNGKIGVACFDNFYGTDDPSYEALRKFGKDRLLITPHIGSLTREARDRMGAMAVDNLIHFLKDGSSDNVVLQGTR